MNKTKTIKLILGKNLDMTFAEGKSYLNVNLTIYNGGNGVSKYIFQIVANANSGIPGKFDMDFLPECSQVPFCYDSNEWLVKYLP